MTQLVFYGCYPTTIAAVRVRKSWTGKLILQVRRHQKRRRVSGGVAGPAEDDGLTQWKDADGNDPSEIAEVMAFLSEKKEA